jgi:hypothetical protein
MIRQRYGRIVFTGSNSALGWFVSPDGPRGDYPCAKSSTAEGFCAHNLAPEDVRDNWAKIYGDVGPDYRIHNMTEVRGLPGEIEILKRTFGD